MPRGLVVLALVLAALGNGAVAQTPPDRLPADVPELLRERIDVRKESVGIVVGILEGRARRVFAHGNAGKGNSRALDGDTLFEIGSITKVFTALLLADMALRGEVALDDPITKLLPSEVKVPHRGDRTITLVDLATHTSGLPRMPTNFRSQDPANPYVDYTVASLYEFLAAHELTRAIGTRYEYSNLGFGLLGHGLARRAGMDYEALVESRISKPLGMNSTRIALPADLRPRLATGHDIDLTPVANWEFSALAGTGALRSSANDLLTFLSANLGFTQAPLSEALRAMLSVRRRAEGYFVDCALGWTIDTRAGGELVWKNGSTAGYRSFIGYSAKTERGVVVLSNAAGNIDDIGLHLLDARFWLAPPPSFPKEVDIEAGVLARYVGRYELGPKLHLTVTRDGDHLFAQVTGQQRFKLYPMSERRFFYKVVEAELTLETDERGQAVALILHQNGVNRRGKRIEEGEAR